MNQLKTNFDSGVKGKELPVDGPSRGGFAHSDDEAHDCGWVKKLEVAPDGQSLNAFFEITNPEVAELADEKSLKYCSCEIDWAWTDPETGQTLPVLEGLSLTNRPYIKRMAPIERVVNLKEFAVQIVLADEGNPNHGADGRFTTGGMAQNDESGSYLTDDKKLDVSGLVGGDASSKEQREKNIEYARSLVGKSVTNDDTGHEIKISRNAIDKLDGGPKVKQDVVPAMQSILKNMLYHHSEEDRKQRGGMKAIHLFTTPTTGDSDLHIVVREDQNGHLYYDWGLAGKPEKNLAEAPVHDFFKFRRSGVAPTNYLIIRQFIDEHYSFLDEKTQFSDEPVGRKSMDTEKTTESNENLQLNELKAKLSESTAKEAAFQARLAELEVTNRETAKELKMTKVIARLKEMAQKGKITPAIYNRVIRLSTVLLDNNAGIVILSEKVKLDEKATGDGTDKLDVINELLDTLDNVPDSISMDGDDGDDEDAKLADDTREGIGTDDPKSMDIKARAKMKADPKLSYLTAVKLVEAERKAGRR